MSRAITIGLCWLLAAGGAGAATLHVPASYATIQEALDAAAPGDTVLLADGLYKGPGNRDLDYAGKAITIRSASGKAQHCVIDAQGSAADPHSAFHFHSGESNAAVLEAVTVRGGYPAGILCVSPEVGVRTEPTIRACILADNPGAGLRQSADYLDWDIGAALRIEDCTISGNQQSGVILDRVGPTQVLRCDILDNGQSGITSSGAYNQDTDNPLLISHCRIASNGGDGVRAYGAFAAVRVADCDILDNQEYGLRGNGPQIFFVWATSCLISRNGAGGVIMENALNDGALYLLNCKLVANQGPGADIGGYTFFTQIHGCYLIDNEGDGVRFRAGSLQQPARQQDWWSWLIRDCFIERNRGLGIRIEGGLAYSRLGISNTEVVANAAGGVRLGAYNSWASPRYGLFGCTIAGNGGTGIEYPWLGVGCQIERTLIAFNSGRGMTAASTDTLTVSCSNIYGNGGGDWVEEMAPFGALEHNFSANPLFCVEPEAGWLLAANSPCLPGQHPGGGDCGLIGAMPAGCGEMAHASARVAIAPAGAVRMHPDQTLALAVSLRDGDDNVVPDMGAPPEASLSQGAGALSPLLLESADSWIWRGRFTPLVEAGIETVLAHDPESAQPTAALAVEITPRAIIEAVTDVPNDQGRQVRLVFQRDLCDTLGSPTPIVEYVAWRRVDDAGGAAGRDEVTMAEAVQRLRDGGDAAALTLVVRQDGALWEPVGPRVPAMMWERYALTAPTLADSTAAGIHWSVFFISAHTPQPQQFFVSAPDSGYSVDNLAPLPPSGLVAHWAAGVWHLQWAPNQESDLHHYRLYRGGRDGFAPSEADTVLVVGGTSWMRPGSPGWRFLLAAVDHAGNASEAVAPLQVTAVADGADEAAERPLLAAPNPFNPGATISFTVPVGGGRVRLTIHDARGRRVCTLVDETLAAGRHQVVWRGRDQRGVRVASGAYLCRLETGGRSATAKLVMLE